MPMSSDEKDKLTRAYVFKYLIDLENDNPRQGLRKRKEVVIGGKNHFFQYAVTDVIEIKFGIDVEEVFMIVIC